jgi:hypothetical protein
MQAQSQYMRQSYQSDPVFREQSDAASNKDSLTQTFFKKLRQVNKSREAVTNISEVNKPSRSMIGLKSRLAMQSVLTTQDSKRMKEINFNKSNLWSYIDATHNQSL